MNQRPGTPRRGGEYLSFVQKNFFPLLLLFVSCTLLFVFLWWHYRLGMRRYIDVDEFAHLSWAYQLVSGRRPYVEFLLFFPPGFHWFLSPLFWFWAGTGPLLAGRFVAFLLFVLLVAMTVYLFWIVRRSWTAVIAGIILAFLPLPYDKFLEIRPDTLATLLAIGGMVCQIIWMQKITQGHDLSHRRWHFLSIAGFLYGLSLFVLPKTLPQVVVAAIVFVSFAVWKKNCKYRGDRAPSPKRLWRVGDNDKYISFPFLVGLGLPLFVFGLWALKLGNLDQVVYSLTKLPVEANKISQQFIMMPDLFFYPNSIFYGAGGWVRGLLVNHALWVLAIFVGIYRFVTPFMEKGRAGFWEEILISGTFIVHIMFYIMIVPLKHAQYLIPIAVFVAWFAADSVYILWTRMRKTQIGTTLFVAIYLAGLIYLFVVNQEIETPKLAWTNKETLVGMEKLFTTIPVSEYILDLDGRTTYYRHPYPVCCLPFGQFAPYLSHPVPSLSEALEKTQTKYIFEGDLKRTSTLLRQDQAYVLAHYLPHPEIAGLLVRK
ncbi:hypothetical protein A2973_05650 [Candidatus Gottesmanbacteria bacterium RIFCSPLOWO2_01_FULL_49_10]|uniref:Glycosyltransferase RgtA/B/C/D-like domain-containing protein n=1 Tax=Candidatus Gottesmanbacteria bacterium RIFCSPLOWO2_01_FULL_49_10 TaxID=1798396 RepID=A0A1F6B0V3_9BACT|nr:MAG: hypothetical protein A2973_05650 [Candidatus Gottesmanbacteria bacterium RIFCSPLOWO2_01_FULL_49_10]